LWDRRRYLTPRETARLQGFPDWVRLPSQYIPLLGNAVAVPCAVHACRAAFEDGIVPRTMVDVCAGMGGFTVAAQQSVRTGVEGVALQCLGFSETNKAAVAAYLDNFPHVPALGDMATVVTWPKCDLFLAGFPCQPFSNSTRRRKHPDRHAVHHVLRAIRSSHPLYLVLENVPGLLTNGAEVWDALMHALTSELGYTIAFATLNASDFGVPQHRKRIYIVGRRDGRPIRLSSVPTPLRPACTLQSVLDH
jgi:DNA (cytosine-5)-methyltransferase 1